MTIEELMFEWDLLSAAFVVAIALAIWFVGYISGRLRKLDERVSSIERRD